MKPMPDMLFKDADLPRRAPLKRMHVADAGQGMVRFQCPHCGNETGWVEDVWTVTENKRGQPCPDCN